MGVAFFWGGALEALLMEFVLVYTDCISPVAATLPTMEEHKEQIQSNLKTLFIIEIQGLRAQHQLNGKLQKCNECWREAKISGIVKACFSVQGCLERKKPVFTIQSPSRHQPSF